MKHRSGPRSAMAVPSRLLLAVGLVAVAALGPATASAAAQAPGTYNFVASYSGDANYSIDARGFVTPGDTVIARGTASIPEGTATLELVAESRDARAVFEDTDSSGVAGLVELVIPFRYERSGERVLASVVPDDGEVERSGRYAATMTFGGRLGSFEVGLDFDFDGRQGRS